MRDSDRHEPGYELVEACGETCDSCQVPLTANCRSCGMPMTGPGDYGSGNTENQYCVHCCHPDGSLKSYEDVLEAMISLMMKMRGLDRAAAESAAREYMATLPAWSNR